MIVVGIQRNILKPGEWNGISLHLHKKGDNEAIATWRLDLDKIFYALMCIPVTYA